MNRPLDGSVEFWEDVRIEGRDASDPSKLQQMTDLNRYLLIDASTGEVLTAQHCYLVADDSLPDAAWLAMADDRWTPEDACVAARLYGRRLEDVVRLRATLPGES